MPFELDDHPQAPEWLLQKLQQMAEVVASERSRIASLEIERDTVLAESLAENYKLLIDRPFRRESNHPAARLGSPKAALYRSFGTPFG